MTWGQEANLWRASSRETVSTVPFDEDRSVDLAVIGGGFTGCAAALEAARQGASVALLEAQEIGHGGSGRNVGLVNAGLWLPPDEITATLGDAAGRRLIGLLGAGPGTVFDIIAREEIACEATHQGTLHCAHAPSGFRDLENRHRQGIAHGAPITLLGAAEAREKVGSEALHGALFDPRAGTVQPLAYCRGLARAAQAAGAALHERSAASAIAQDGDGWRITCNGRTLRAAALLVATNAYHDGLTDVAPPRFTPVHYAQFATAPMPVPLRARILPMREGCWDTALVMSSFRTDTDGRMIIGGMGNLDGPGGPVHAGWARRKLRALFPEIGDLPFEHGWCGRIAMTSDHIPKIVTTGTNGLTIFGYSGRGIAPGTVFGTSAATALLGKRMDALPLAPVAGHSETLTTMRAAYYEFGATLTHALRPLPV